MAEKSKVNSIYNGLSNYISEHKMFFVFIPITGIYAAKFLQHRQQVLESAKLVEEYDLMVQKFIADFINNKNTKMSAILSNSVYVEQLQEEIENMQAYALYSGISGAFTGMLGFMDDTEILQHLKDNYDFVAKLLGVETYSQSSTTEEYVDA